jgi:hypothetical protein
VREGPMRGKLAIHEMVLELSALDVLGVSAIM